MVPDQGQSVAGLLAGALWLMGVAMKAGQAEARPAFVDGFAGLLAALNQLFRQAGCRRVGALREHPQELGHHPQRALRQVHAACQQWGELVHLVHRFGQRQQVVELFPEPRIGVGRDRLCASHAHGQRDFLGCHERHFRRGFPHHAVGAAQAVDVQLPLQQVLVVHGAQATADDADFSAMCEQPGRDGLHRVFRIGGFVQADRLAHGKCGHPLRLKNMGRHRDQPVADPGQPGLRARTLGRQPQDAWWPIASGGGLGG